MELEEPKMIENESYRMTFIANHSRLVRKLTSPELIAKTFERELLTVYEKQLVESEKTEIQRVDKLLSIFHRRYNSDTTIFVTLLEILKEINEEENNINDHVISALKESLRNPPTFPTTFGMMDELHKRRLKQHEKILLTLDVMPILPDLFSMGVVSFEESERIKNESDASEKGKILVDLLWQCSSDVFYEFIVVLRESTIYERLANKLNAETEEEMDKEDEQYEPATTQLQQVQKSSTEEHDGLVGASSNSQSLELKKTICVQDQMQTLLQLQLDDFALKCFSKQLISSAMYGKVFNPSSSSDSERAGYLVYQVYQRIKRLETDGKEREAQDFIQKFARVIRDTDIVFKDIANEIAQTRDSFSFLGKQDRIKSSIQCSLNTVTIKALSKELITEDEMDAATDPDANHKKRCMCEIFQSLRETIKESPSQFQVLLAVLKAIGPPISTVVMKIDKLTLT